MHPCPRCEYDLTGLPDVHICPECGFAYDPHAEVFEIGPPHVPASKTFVIVILGAVGIGLAIALELRSAAQWLFGFSMLLAAFVAYLRWPHSRKHRLIVNRQGIFIIRPAASDQHMPWSKIHEIRHNWLTGAIQFIDRESKNVPVHLALRVQAFAASERCVDEIRRLQALYSSSDWQRV